MYGLALMSGNTLFQREGSNLVILNPVRSLLISGTKLCNLFERIVSQVYRIDMMHTAENRITGIVTPMADRILEMFLSEEEDIIRPFEALFYACYIAKEVFETNDNTIESQFVQKAEAWCRSALSLAEKVVQTRMVVTYLPLLVFAKIARNHLDSNFKSIDN
jgi:hypothetical protein